MPAQVGVQQRTPPGPVVYGGEDALHRLAESLRGEIHPRLRGHLTWFALPLAARRAVDAARFLIEGGRQDLGTVLAEKAQLFGEANYHAVNGRWRKVGDIVERLSALEQRLVKEL